MRNPSPPARVGEFPRRAAVAGPVLRVSHVLGAGRIHPAACALRARIALRKPSCAKTAASRPHSDRDGVSERPRTRVFEAAPGPHAAAAAAAAEPPLDSAGRRAHLAWDIFRVPTRGGVIGKRGENPPRSRHCNGCPGPHVPPIEGSGRRGPCSGPESGNLPGSDSPVTLRERAPPVDGVAFGPSSCGSRAEAGPFD